MRKHKVSSLQIELVIVTAIILISGTSAYAQQIELANVPTTLGSGQCSLVAHVKLYQAGIPITAPSKIVVSLGSTGAAPLAFYSQSNCTAQISSVAIPKGSLQTKFYFSSGQPGAGTMTASAQSSGLNVVSANVTISSTGLAALGVEESEMVRIINNVRSDAGLAKLQV